MLAIISSSAVLVYLLLMPKATSVSVINSINSCLYGVIPSLFCFIVLSKLIANSGFAYIISKPFGNLFSRFSGIPGIGFSIYIFSFLSGYPSGVIASGELYKNHILSKEDTEWLSAISNNTGPALPVILIGGHILNNVKLGIIIYVIQIISSVTACYILRKNAVFRENVYPDLYNKNLLSAITNSVEGGIKSTAIMCGYIILFNVMGDALINTFGNSDFLQLVRPFIEIVSGCSALARYNSSLVFVIISTAVSFGGICVHMQSAAVMSSYNISTSIHTKFKLTEALCAFIISCVVVFFREICLF